MAKYNKDQILHTLPVFSLLELVTENGKYIPVCVQVYVSSKHTPMCVHVYEI